MNQQIQPNTITRAVTLTVQRPSGHCLGDISQLFRSCFAIFGRESGKVVTLNHNLSGELRDGWQDDHPKIRRRQIHQAAGQRMPFGSPAMDGKYPGVVENPEIANDCTVGSRTLSRARPEKAA